jgi:endonuclease-3
VFSKETRRRKIRKIIPILKEEYPDAGPRLHFSNPLELLIATILAAQCTDDRVNEVTKDLFKKYRTAKDYAEANPGELMTEIYSTGTFRRKTNYIKLAGEALVNQHGGRVPQDG